MFTNVKLVDQVREVAGCTEGNYLIVDAQALKACALACGKPKKTAWYQEIFACVNVTTTYDPQVMRIAATDSYRLHVIDAYGDFGDNIEYLKDDSVTLNCPDVIKLVKNKTSLILFDFTKMQAFAYNETRFGTVEPAGVAMFEIGVGNFPKYKQLLPDTFSENVGFGGCINPGYLSDACKVFELLDLAMYVFQVECDSKHKKPVIFNGQHETHPELRAISLVMPITTEAQYTAVYKLREYKDPNN